jgi:hypothetical protein
MVSGDAIPSLAWQHVAVGRRLLVATEGQTMHPDLYAMVIEANRTLLPARLERQRLVREAAASAPGRPEAVPRHGRPAWVVAQLRWTSGAVLIRLGRCVQGAPRVHPAPEVAAA